MIAAGTKAPIPIGGKRNADKPGREAVEEQRGHCKVVAELLEAGGVFGKVGDPGGDREETDERE